ncbi:MAG: hypothetical protein WCF96_05360 [Eubacteriales bacterium]
MIIKNRGSFCKTQVSSRPLSSIPKKEGSIYFDLQVLHSRKNMLQNIITTCETKANAAKYELNRVESEIDDMEAYISQRRRDVQVGTGYYQPGKLNENNPYNKIKIIEVEY